jgi:hypothetical protein
MSSWRSSDVTSMGLRTLAVLALMVAIAGCSSSESTASRSTRTGTEAGWWSYPPLSSVQYFPSTATNQNSVKRAEDARLVARKLRGVERHVRSYITYPSQGVDLSAPRSDAQSEAAAAGLRTASQAMIALREDLAARVFPISPKNSSHPHASLKTVIEHLPVVRGVTAGVPYQAWVVTMSGPALVIGGGDPGSTSGSTRVPTCQDIAIYDLRLKQWTEYIQSC